MAPLLISAAVAFGAAALAALLLGFWAGAAVPVLVALYYAGVGIGVYGNGFGDGWEFGVAALLLASAAGALTGGLARRARRSA